MQPPVFPIFERLFFLELRPRITVTDCGKYAVGFLEHPLSETFLLLQLLSTFRAEELENMTCLGETILSRSAGVHKVRTRGRDVLGGSQCGGDSKTDVGGNQP